MLVGLATYIAERAYRSCFTDEHRQTVPLRCTEKVEIGERWKRPFEEAAQSRALEIALQRAEDFLEQLGKEKIPIENN